jgi:SAM-dependent methyltransferase
MDTDLLEPAKLLLDYWRLFSEGSAADPILDLACGSGKNGIYLAAKGCNVVLCDRSPEALESARQLASKSDVIVKFIQVDLEKPHTNPLPQDSYSGILVFRYLHRPLIPCIKKALNAGGLLMYETFTEEQRAYGKPHNPDHLLRLGELRSWFEDWEIIHWFEGFDPNPPRAIAQLVTRKPA